MTTSALGVYAQALTHHAAGGSPTSTVRLHDGSVRPLEVGRWVQGADAVDQHALAALHGPVLDVGCGPGRHLHALARRGVFGLGVDLCPTAVQLARGRGANAIVGSIFGDVPYAGNWRSALLLDGNIGIGGRPDRLLARIETTTAISDWFAWAEVSAASIGELADAAAVHVCDVWQTYDRWFARLVAP